MMHKNKFPVVFGIVSFCVPHVMIEPLKLANAFKITIVNNGNLTLRKRYLFHVISSNDGCDASPN